MTSGATPDEIYAEVLRVRALLEQLPALEVEERARLESRLAELRTVAQREQLTRHRDRSELENHLRRLEDRLRLALDGHVSQSAAGQTGRGGGIDPEYVHRLNSQVDEGMNVAGIRAEIARIRFLLDSTADPSVG